MSTQAPLFTRQDLSDRVSAKVLTQLADDDKSGAADSTIVATIIRDASAVVWSFLPADYNLPASGVTPDYLKKLAIDIGQAQLYNRFPQTNLASQGTALLGRAMSELERFAEGITRIPTISEVSQSYVLSDPPRGSLTK